MRGVAGFLAIACLMAALPALAQTTVVAAENFYGDVARQIGGSSVRVESILTNPDQDPHLFEASPKVGRTLAKARIAVVNGADYDPWMDKLLGATRAADRQVIVVADLVGKKAGDNPHLWYDPATVPAYARALAASLDKADPASAQGHAQHLAAFLASLGPLDDKIAAMKARYAGQAVTATEPVFGYMATALGLTMRNEPFQLAVMNDTEPAASMVAAFEDDLRQHKVRALIYNGQASGAAAEQLEKIARASHVPVVAVTETMPKGAKSYQDWMTRQLDVLDKALSAPPPA